jgi:2-methylisocitrate lyase-like PEP mutase family enzyme
MEARKVLRAALASGPTVLAPGAYDALSAKIVEAAGFSAVYATGGGISRSMGYPDVGLLSLTEVVDRLRSIVEAVTVPVIADADTGYGNALNVIRAVRTFEAAGVAALHLEDQVAPKRCGHYEGKEVIPCEEMVLKLRAALDARREPDLVLIARTDARAPLGLEEAIRRAKAYAAAGADVVFVEAPQSREELVEIARRVPVPLLVNMFEGGKTPLVPLRDLEAMGYRIVIIPSDLQRAAIRAMQETAEVIRRDGDSRAVAQRLATFQEREALVGLDRVQALEARYLRGAAGPGGTVKTVP